MWGRDEYGKSEERMRWKYYTAVQGAEAAG